MKDSIDPRADASEKEEAVAEAGTAALRLNENGRVLFANAKAKEILGPRPDRELVELWKGARACRKRSVSVLVTIRKSDGDQRPCRATFVRGEAAPNEGSGGFALLSFPNGDSAR